MFNFFSILDNYNMEFIIPITLTSSIILTIAVLFVILRFLRVKLPSAIDPKHVVITGGSSGLGLALAKEINKKNPGCKITIEKVLKRSENVQYLLHKSSMKLE